MCIWIINYRAGDTVYQPIIQLFGFDSFYHEIIRANETSSWPIVQGLFKVKINRKKTSLYYLVLYFVDLSSIRIGWKYHSIIHVNLSVILHLNLFSFENKQTYSSIDSYLIRQWNPSFSSTYLSTNALPNEDSSMCFRWNTFQANQTRTFDDIWDW